MPRSGFNYSHSNQMGQNLVFWDQLKSKEYGKYRWVHNHCWELEMFATVFHLWKKYRKIKDKAAIIKDTR